MDILGRTVSDDVTALYDEISARWPKRKIAFVADSDIESEGLRQRTAADSSLIHIPDQADDGVIYHELLHDYLLKLGSPTLAIPEDLGGFHLDLMQLVELRVSHPYVQAESSRRGFARLDYFRQMEAGLLAWDYPEARRAIDRLKNAAIVAEYLVCSPLDTVPVRDHISATYPQMWPVTEQIVEAITPPAKRTFSSWRRALVGLIALAQAAFSEDGVTGPSLDSVITVTPVYTTTELARTARRLVDITPMTEEHVVALTDRRDHSLLAWKSAPGWSVEQAEKLKSRLFLNTKAFVEEMGISYTVDAAI